MGYTATRPYDPDRLPDPVISPSQVEQYQWARRTCSEGFRNRSVNGNAWCGPPVIEAFMASKPRSMNDTPGRWWVLCQFHADKREVWQLPDVSEEQGQMAL